MHFFRQRKQVEVPEPVITLQKDEDVLMDGQRFWSKAKYTRVWHPTPGEILVAEFLGLQLRSGSYGQYYRTIVRPEDERDTMAVTGTMLANALIENDIVPGQMIRIVYGGIRESATGGYPYKILDLWVAR